MTNMLTQVIENFFALLCWVNCVMQGKFCKDMQKREHGKKHCCTHHFYDLSLRHAEFYFYI